MNNHSMETKLLKVRVSDVIFDREYQRDLDENRAKRMADSFNVGLFGVPVVSVRANGEIAVIDGQHRFSARSLTDRKDDMVTVEAHRGLTVKQEAELFLRLNGGRTAVHTWDKWRARLTSHEPTAMEMTAIANSVGARFALSPSTKFCISALNKAERVHKQFKTLRETLSLLVELGEGDPQWLSGDMLVAVGAFLHKHGKNADREILMAVLSKNPPSVLTSRIRGKADVVAIHFEEMSKIVIAEIYNARAKGKNKLK